ncbi:MULTISPECIES: FtsH protease activity modulator HflK [Pseudoxanthomonas]|jgi:membrane protease subunit HflK|uniref:FtsH protease activity modulator HflK n=1 Tax=Pseudoxanthomonas TaxID=83618 RepID=UPI0016136CC7|nr:MULTISPECIES: FtsH protease activity modulator HflK [Pseudoxanthomonas]MBB3275083.1 membrane protease subunit HflK [Pseudoxanthomonas sp. OG2]MBD9379147.1 FtsH protease activity modulator HflK [Pseudoxanthomonas sp. PXM04]MBV7473825.1 FtsH protease activity modulator HflK [Pseudoxanthomonas sp. PXM05]
MAWNTPGSGGSGSGGGNGNNDNRRGWNPRGGNSGGGLGDLLDRLRGSFDGNGPLRWIGVALLLLVLFSSFQLIGEQQRGVVLRFGQFSRVMQPGPNFKWPWPIESVTKVNATEIKNFSNTMPVLTRDENIVTVSVNVQYRIADPRLYLYGSRNADDVLQQAAQSAVREQVGRSDLDTVLGERGPLGSQAKERLQASLDTYRTGLVVTELNLPDARPPEEVKPAFDEVNSAQQIKDRLVNEARAYAARIVPEARGTAARTRTVAEGYKAATVARAQGDADRFSLLQEQYKNAPDVTRKRLWLDTVQQVLQQNNRKVIGGDSRQLIYLPMPAQTGAAPASSSAPAPEVVMPAVESSATTPLRSAERPARSAGREESGR